MQRWKVAFVLSDERTLLDSAESIADLRVVICGVTDLTCHFAVAVEPFKLVLVTTASTRSVSTHRVREGFAEGASLVMANGTTIPAMWLGIATISTRAHPTLFECVLCPLAMFGMERLLAFPVGLGFLDLGLGAYGFLELSLSLDSVGFSLLARVGLSHDGDLKKETEICSFIALVTKINSYGITRDFINSIF